MSRKHLRILFTSAGRRVELLRCFRHAAHSLDINLDVLACDLNASMSSACHAADQAFDVPHCSDPYLLYPNTYLPTIDPNTLTPRPSPPNKPIPPLPPPPPPTPAPNEEHRPHATIESLDLLEDCLSRLNQNYSSALM